MFLHAYGQGEAKVNAGVEFGHVVVQVELADLGVCGENMLDKRAEVNTVKSFCWIVWRPPSSRPPSTVTLYPYFARGKRL
jgi:hypothetical protein